MSQKSINNAFVFRCQLIFLSFQPQLTISSSSLLPSVIFLLRSTLRKQTQVFKTCRRHIQLCCHDNIFLLRQQTYLSHSLTTHWNVRVWPKYYNSELVFFFFVFMTRAINLPSEIVILFMLVFFSVTK